ncbi:HigA family addiction module antitoxin [Yersinia mollaretii]|uniref:HigA family addiction module antitoxin n=1 Tax=Yersinia mollaretii TaxID=33060 RepID=UPI00061B9D4E|nr:HigA family addiction module antitoxin [Yersinia mollaretii]CNJ55055.1 antidote protein [Yersinia mollaretii]
MINLFEPVHPGEFIREMFMEPFEISDADLAERLHISPSTLSRVINGKTDLSVEMALKLSKVLGRSPESWISMQAQYSLAIGRKNIGNELKDLKPLAFC